LTINNGVIPLIVTLTYLFLFIVYKRLTVFVLETDHTAYPMIVRLGMVNNWWRHVDVNEYWTNYV